MEKVYFVIKRLEDIKKIGDSLSLPILEHCLGKTDRKAFSTSVLSYSLLNELLDNFNIDINQLSFSSNGKPLIEDGYISISHSEEYIAVSYSKINHGIDIQFFKEIENKEGIIKKYFNNYYSKYMEISNEEKDELFFKLWSIKECVTKKEDGNIFSDLNSENIYIFNTTLHIKTKKYAFSVVADESFEVKEMHF